MSNLTDKTTPEGKGVRTAVQAALSTLGLFFYGLWNLPGVSEYTTNFLKTEGVAFGLLLAGLVGIPAGVIAFLMNKKGK